VGHGVLLVSWFVKIDIGSAVDQAAADNPWPLSAFIILTGTAWASPENNAFWMPA
jgi:hypothetical protein